jgi:hypothetical protein
MPWCIVCQRQFDAKRPYGTRARCCSGRCRAIASRKRRAMIIRERLERAESAIQEAKEMLAVRPRSRKRTETASEGSEGE